MDSAIQQLSHQPLRLMGLFTKRQSTPQQTFQETKLCTPGDAESVGRSISEFYYETDMESTFPKWLAHYKDLIGFTLLYFLNGYRWLLGAKISRKIGYMIHLFLKQKVVDVGKLISFGNLLVI